MLYETKNSLGDELLKTETNTDFNFPMHLHGSFEFITATEGELCVSVDGCDYKLGVGDALLIFPNQVHDIKTESHSSHFLCIFSQKLVQGYSDIYRSKLPRSNLFTPEVHTVESLMRLCTGNISKLHAKGILYSLCAQFDDGAEYREKDAEPDGLLEKIFSFVESSYNGDCSLEALSAHTSYHYVYLSRYFKSSTGISFTDYVNRYRINEAGYMLKNRAQSVLRIAYDCGFDSLRSFNRNFKKIMNMTPIEYRNARILTKGE